MLQRGEGDASPAALRLCRGAPSSGAGSYLPAPPPKAGTPLLAPPSSFKGKRGPPLSVPTSPCRELHPCLQLCTNHMLGITSVRFIHPLGGTGRSSISLQGHTGGRTELARGGTRRPPRAWEGQGGSPEPLEASLLFFPQRRLTGLEESASPVEIQWEALSDLRSGCSSSRERHLWGASSVPGPVCTAGGQEPQDHHDACAHGSQANRKADAGPRPRLWAAGL